MNELQIFSNPAFGEIKNFEKNLKDTYLGIFYAVEYGQAIKIGHTKKPYTRIVTLKRAAEKYGDISLGRVCISKAHTNHEENEKKLHEHFAKARKAGTELFNISFDDFISAVSLMGIEYKDESPQIKARSEAFLRGMKSLLLGGERQ